MPKKYNDNSNEFKDWTTKKLKQEAKYYHELINNNVSSYGSHDIQNFIGIQLELDNRGIQINTNLCFN